jgi:hypothetical protein
MHHPVAVDLFQWLDEGGIVAGPRGSAQMVVAHGGETVLPTHKGPVALAVSGGSGASASTGAVLAAALCLCHWR